MSIVEGGEAGPTVLIFAGGHAAQGLVVHGLQQVSGYPLTRGRLVTVALNGTLPSPLITNTLEEHGPDWIVELREDLYHGREGMATRGGLVLHCAGSGEDDTARVARSIASAINEAVPDARDHFRAELARSDDRSLAFEDMSDRSIRSLVCVSSARKNTTPTREHRDSVRIRRQRLAVHGLLVELEMLAADHDPDEFLPPRGEARHASGRLYLAVYDGDGSGAPMPWIVDLQNGVRGLEGHPLDPRQIASGALERFDVVLFPGGMASHQYDALGVAGREAVVRFVRDGGGYVGVCAGAYMAASDPYPWGLNLLDAHVVDHEHWARGIGPVEIELSAAGSELFGPCDGRMTCHYGQGPVLAPAGRQDLEDFEVLAWFRTGIGTNGADPEVMVDTPAIVTGPHGRGRVLAASPHVEWSAGLEPFILDYVTWAAGR